MRVATLKWYAPWPTLYTSWFKGTASFHKKLSEKRGRGADRVRVKLAITSDDMLEVYWTVMTIPV